jgi:uncharacterized protein YggE
VATISVLGSASRRLLPDLGTARLVVRLESVDRAAVARAAAALHGRLTADARGLEQEGSVTRWTAGQVWTSTIDYERGNRPRERRAVATATVRVTFRDFGALGEWLGALAGADGLELAGIEWALEDERRQETEREVRREAILDARARALAYAEALGFDGVELQSAEEPGSRGHGRDDMVYASGARDGMAEAYDLRPDELEVEATIAASFTTG